VKKKLLSLQQILLKYLVNRSLNLQKANSTELCKERGKGIGGEKKKIKKEKRTEKREGEEKLRGRTKELH